MFFEYDGIKMYYTTEGTGAAVVFLHGWGGSTDSFAGAVKLCARSYFCVNPDFFGFGKSDPPKNCYGIAEYCDATVQLIKSLGITCAVIVAHSFGGRVALQSAAKYPELVNKLVLVDSAGIPARKSVKKRLAVAKYKRLKRRGADVSGYGSEDYRALGAEMREVFVRVVNTDARPCLKAIRAPTLIVWGENDRDTPPYMAKRLKRGIRGSGLVMLEGAGHYGYIERHNDFIRILFSFLGSSEK
ncbi:MAG: alpha/beta hydrolase [Firmicutes bacterium]|nr:alpha/beta hydrolase [Bacillota bacterium]